MDGNTRTFCRVSPKRPEAGTQPAYASRPAAREAIPDARTCVTACACPADRIRWRAAETVCRPGMRRHISTRDRPRRKQRALVDFCAALQQPPAGRTDDVVAGCDAGHGAEVPSQRCRRDRRVVASDSAKADVPVRATSLCASGLRRRRTPHSGVMPDRRRWLKLRCHARASTRLFPSPKRRTPALSGRRSWAGAGPKAGRASFTW